MPENPKEFLKLVREGLGPVEQTASGARIAFKDSEGRCAVLNEASDDITLSLEPHFPNHPTLALRLTRKQAYQFVNTLQRWIKTSHLG